MSFIPLLQAEAAQGGGFMTLIMFALIFVIFYVFIIRPQNKKQKETEKMINAIKKGDKVITIGGLHGEVSAVREKTFVIKVEDGSKLEFSRSAISNVVNPQPAEPEKSEKPAKKEGREEKASKAEKSEKSDAPSAKDEEKAAEDEAGVQEGDGQDS